jgi:hypothetical protein
MICAHHQSAARNAECCDKCLIPIQRHRSNRQRRLGRIKGAVIHGLHRSGTDSVDRRRD